MSIQCSIVPGGMCRKYIIHRACRVVSQERTQVYVSAACFSIFKHNISSCGLILLPLAKINSMSVTWSIFSSYWPTWQQKSIIHVALLGLVCLINTPQWLPSLLSMEKPVALITVFGNSVNQTLSNIIHFFMTAHLDWKENNNLGLQTSPPQWKAKSWS